MSAFSTFDIAGSALSAQSLRLNLTASNLANMHNVAGDPAAVYRGRQAVFQAASDPFGSVLAGVDVLGVIESTAEPITEHGGEVEVARLVVWRVGIGEIRRQHLRAPCAKQQRRLVHTQN